MTAPLLAGTGRLDRSALVDIPAGGNGLFAGLVRSGGLVAAAGPTVPDTSPATLHHRGSLYALGYMNVLAPAGGRGVAGEAGGTIPEYWEPPFAFGHPRAVARRPRLLVVVGGEGFSEVLLAAHVAGAYPGSALEAAGVAVWLAVLTTTVRLTARPLTAALPLASAAEYAEPGTGALNRLALTYPDPALYRGGDVMVADYNATLWTYGNSYDPASSTATRYGYTYLAGSPGSPPTAPAGAVGLPVSADPDLRVVVHHAEAAADRAAMAAGAARFRSYLHQVYHESTYGTAGGVDEAAIFSLVAGDPPAGFVSRRVVAAGLGQDVAALWDQIVADATDFFA